MVELEKALEVVTVVGKDGRITIPVKVREAIGINQGDAIRMMVEGEKVTFYLVK